MKARDARPVLVIASTTVDQNRMVTGPQHPRVNARDQAPLPFIEARRHHQRPMLLQNRRVPIREQNLGRETRSTLLDDLSYRYLADRMTHRDQLNRSTGFS